MNSIANTLTISAALTLGCFGAMVSLDFNTLPSAQGWTYGADGPSHAGQLEGDIFSVDGSMLSMNTIGSPTVSPSGVAYTQSGLLNATGPIVVTFTSRTLQSQNSGFGFGVAISALTEQYTVGFATNEITLLNGPVIAQDTTAFHEYRIEATPGEATYDFYIDGVLRGSAPPVAVNLNRIVIGDLSGGANAQADISEFTFTQVPEPTSLVLLGLSEMFSVWRRARR